jgi:DNA-binding CsgD family transcriptional regulator
MKGRSIEDELGVRARPPIMRGRDHELACVGEQLNVVRSGVGAIMMLEGRAGYGKSRMLEETSTIAGRLGFRVGQGRAEPGDATVHLAPLFDALFGGAQPLITNGLPRPLHSLPEQRYWLLQELQESLERAALDGPLAICIDDMQWSDGGSLAALRALAPRLTELPIAWMIAFRPDPRSADLARAVAHLDHSGASKITLGALGDAPVAAVAADILGARPDAALLGIAKRAHGSPFLLTELLLGLHEERLVRIDSGRAELLESRLPLRVSTTMRRQLERLPASVREALTGAAAFERCFSLSDLASLLGAPAATLVSALEELIAADLLSERGGRLAFSHELTREAVRASLPVSVLRALDRQAVEVLLDRGVAPVELASQLAASAEPGDGVAIRTLYKVAETLVTSDPWAASDLGERALELAPRTHALRGPLTAQTAVALHATGRAETARALAEAALREALPAAQQAEIRLSIAVMFDLSADVRIGAGRLALELDDVPEALRARHLAWLVYNLYVAGRAQDAQARLVEARGAVRASGDSAAKLTLVLAEGGLEHFQSRFARSLELIERATQTNTGAQEYARGCLAQAWRCELMMLMDYVEEPLELAADWIAAARQDRQSWALRIFEALRGRQLLQMGRLRDATAALEKQLDSDPERAPVGIFDVAAIAALDRVAQHTGDARQARRIGQIARLAMRNDVPAVRMHGAWLLAMQALSDGDPHTACAWLRGRKDESQEAILRCSQIAVSDGARLAKLAVAAKDTELADMALAGAELRAKRNPEVRSILATAAHVRGILHGSRDELSQAASLFESCRRPLAQAEALEDLALHDIGRGAAIEAVDALDRALTINARSGASRDAYRVRSRLRELGERRRVVAVARVSSGWAAMTPSEIKVAGLVAEGMTNREVAARLFLSPHTVSSHLRHVFAKLDINSRVELARASASRATRVEIASTSVGRV